MEYSFFLRDFLKHNISIGINAIKIITTNAPPIAPPTTADGGSLLSSE